MNGCYIEFIGLSGAGKSTLSKEISKRLNLEGYSCAIHQPFSKEKSCKNDVRRIFFAFFLLINFDGFVFNVFNIKFRNYSAYPWKKCFVEVKRYLLCKQFQKKVLHNDYAIWEIGRAHV